MTACFIGGQIAGARARRVDAQLVLSDPVTHQGTVQCQWPLGCRQENQQETDGSCKPTRAGCGHVFFAGVERLTGKNINNLVLDTMVRFPTARIL